VEIYVSRTPAERNDRNNNNDVLAIDANDIGLSHLIQIPIGSVKLYRVQHLILISIGNVISYRVQHLVLISIGNVISYRVQHLTSYLPMLFKKHMLTNPIDFLK